MRRQLRKSTSGWQPTDNRAGLQPPGVCAVYSPMTFVRLSWGYAVFVLACGSAGDGQNGGGPAGTGFDETATAETGDTGSQGAGDGGHQATSSRDDSGHDHDSGRASSDGQDTGGAGATETSGDESSATATTSAMTSGSDPTDSSASASAGDDGGQSGDGTVDVTLTGCDVDFGGRIIAVYNGDSFGVSSIYNNGGTLSGGFQFALTGPGMYALSTQQRVDTGTVVNLIDPAQGTWTNIDSQASISGVDHVGGTLTVTTWQPSAGITDIHFDGVQLINVSTQQVCTIDGTIVTDDLL